MPTLGVTSPVAFSGIDAIGALEVPSAPTTVGWWAGGPIPGGPSGTAVLAAHVGYAGVAGAFAHLDSLRPDDRITVETTAGPVRFSVTGVREYPKATLPWAAIFSGGGPPRLALVTCGGGFDRATGHYYDNVVVFAVPSG